MSKLWMVPVAALCGLLLVVACSEDDDGGTVTPETADMVGTWTGLVYLGPTVFAVTAVYEIDSSVQLDASVPANDTVPETPVYRSVGTYSVNQNIVTMLGDTCTVLLGGVQAVACSTTTATVTGTTLRTTMNIMGVPIQPTLIKQGN